METLLGISKLIQEKVVILYQEAGEKEVNFGYWLRKNSLGIEIPYPKHVNKLFSELLAVCL